MARTEFQLVSEEAPLIVVPVLVNGNGPFTFVLDTGASHVVAIGIDGAVIEGCPAVIMDIEGIRQAMKGDADGILGYSYLKDFRLTIDYPRSTIVFERAKT